MELFESFPFRQMKGWKSPGGGANLHWKVKKIQDWDNKKINFVYNPTLALLDKSICWVGVVTTPNLKKVPEIFESVRDRSFLMPGTGAEWNKGGTKIFCNIYMGYKNFLLRGVRNGVMGYENIFE